MQLDAIDLRILAELQQDGRLTNVELARRVHLSPSPCLARVKALEANGVIERYVALASAKALGLGLATRQGTRIPVDDPGLDPVFEAAGELGMPVAIHTGDPEAFWLPVDERNPRRAELAAHPGWALHGRPVPSFDELLAELERRIARHPRTTFISVHFGNAAERPDYVARMLRTYPNLYVDTAARIPELGRIVESAWQWRLKHPRGYA